MDASAAQLIEMLGDDSEALEAIFLIADLMVRRTRERLRRSRRKSRTIQSR
jgi:hypothetical protein